MIRHLLEEAFRFCSRSVLMPVSLLFFMFSFSIAAQTPEELLKVEKDKREAVVAESKLLTDEAEKLFSNGKFYEACEKCTQAKAKLSSMSGPFIEQQNKKIDAQLLTIKKQWAAKLESDANTAFFEKRYEASASLARTAIGINPERQKVYEEIIKKANKYNDSVKYDDAAKLSAIDPDNKDRKRDVAVLLAEAKTNIKNERYDQARESLEKILVKDPYNIEATQTLDKVYRKLYAVAQHRREVEFDERMAEVEWTWNQGILPTKAIRPVSSLPVPGGATKAGIFEKLQNIVFDKIEFDDAAIGTVISYLKARSQQLDPEGQGVGLTLQLASDAAKDAVRVTMNFDNIPMYEAIKYLCQQTGLKYRIDEKAVLIGDKDIDEMETKFFPVRSELIASIMGNTNAASASEKTDVMGDEGFGFTAKDTFKAAAKAPTTNKTAGGGAAGNNADSDPDAIYKALRLYFSDRGVPFETGATIAYEKRSGKLIVKNTPENLRKLEHLLRDLDIQTPLVLIEAKILELSRTNVEELGFDWTFQSTTSANGDRDPSVDFGPNSYLLRHYQDADNVNSNDQNPTKFPNKMVNALTLPNVAGYDISLTVNALAQTSRAEILSTPKVIATSGKQALIRMVQEQYFPKSWTIPTVSTSTSGFNYTPSYPEFGDPTDIGIRFEVTPFVGSNNYTISLHLNPQVIAFKGWTEYITKVRVTSNATSAATGVETGNYDQDIKMPLITRRVVDTNVKVFDGETVVMGGMLNNKNKARHDKDPGLGDLPLFGRAFQSNMEYDDKTNLLMFVTARLINSDGVPVRANVTRGLPEFPGR